MKNIRRGLFRWNVLINEISRVILIFFFIAVAFMVIYGSFKSCDLDKHGKILVGKYIRQKKYPKSQENYFVYFVNGRRLEGYTTEKVPNGFDKNIGRFYKIKYYDKYPNSFHAIFEEEVTDTSMILQNGFAIEDIE